jgi:hypothetical protein
MESTYYIDADDTEKLTVEKTDGCIVLKLPGNFVIYFDVENLPAIKKLSTKMENEIWRKLSRRLTDPSVEKMLRMLTENP